MTAPYLDIEGLSVALRQGGRLLRRVTLKVHPGEVHALVGESGVGKSMIARAVFGILPPAVEVLEGRHLPLLLETGGKISQEWANLARLPVPDPLTRT